MYQLIKTTFFALSLTLVAAPAFAADEMHTVVECTSIHAGPDFGLMAKVQTGGIAGITFATVSEQSIMGPQPIGRIAVRQEQHGMMTTFVGTDFSLEIIRERLPHHPDHGLSAKLVTEMHGRRVSEDMNCEFTKREQSPITCMAYWSGYIYDTELGQCVKKGASGCSNPFPFQSLESCQMANAMDLH